jgi:threonyl-tRNA synthetase
MLHRAILGTLERFIGVYLEHCSGHLPTWLAPVQMQILNVTDRQTDYCQELKAHFEKQGLRVHFDARGEKLGFKIREAQLQKVPYMLIIGDNELEKRFVSVRLRNGQNVNNLSLQELTDVILSDVRERKLASPLMASNQEASN